MKGCQERGKEIFGEGEKVKRGKEGERCKGGKKGEGN